MESVEGLTRGAVSVAMQYVPDVKVDEVEAALDNLADSISQRLRTPSISAKLAHAHDVIFDEIGYRGDAQDYYNPDNSFLPVVIERGKGMPILLCLMYQAVMYRLGIQVYGLNTPGHFMVEVIDQPPQDESEGSRQKRGMIVDPFYGGTLLTFDEAYERMESVIMRPIARDGSNVSRASHRQWLLRILNNLVHIYDRECQRENMGAALEMMQALEQHS